MHLGEVIRWERREANLSQTELAERLGISKQYLCDIEAGARKPGDEELIAKLVEALPTRHINPDWLYFVIGKLPPDLVGIDVSATDVALAFHVFRRLVQSPH